MRERQESPTVSEDSSSKDLSHILECQKQHICIGKRLTEEIQIRKLRKSTEIREEYKNYGHRRILGDSLSQSGYSINKRKFNVSSKNLAYR